MEVLALLKSKNRGLEKFLAISRDFMKSLASDPELKGLDRFHLDRDATLKVIDLYDRKISESVILSRDEAHSPDLIKQVRAELNRKESIIRTILDIDLEIMSKIEEARNHLMQELTASRKSQDTLNKFKSRWVPESGEGIDRKL